MTNFEKYNKLHDEVMKRLENGEITVEQAKEVNDLAFDKYITEAKILDSHDFRKNLENRSKYITKTKIPDLEEVRRREIADANNDLTWTLMDIHHEYDPKIKAADTEEEKNKLKEEKQKKIDAEKAKTDALIEAIKKKTYETK